jgi:hypothetical protein
MSVGSVAGGGAIAQPPANGWQASGLLWNLCSLGAGETLAPQFEAGIACTVVQAYYLQNSYSRLGF